MIAPPTITIGEPALTKTGRFAVAIHVSTEPTMRYREFGDTPDEADSRAREFCKRRLKEFHKSQAAKHARSEKRIAQAREARSAARKAGEAA